MRKRNIQKTFYLSVVELETLIKKCNELNINHSKYIRDLFIDYEPYRIEDSFYDKSNEIISNLNMILEDINTDLQNYNYVKKIKLELLFNKINAFYLYISTILKL